MQMEFEHAQTPSQAASGRMQSLDIVRAAAIMFVILGHALIYAECADFLMGCIYSFHMGLLFVLSGFVTAASWERSGAAGPQMALRKIGRSARRLLIPYAFCGIAVVPMVNFMQTGRFAHSFITGWRNAFLLNRFLWYLPCCFFLICIFAAAAAHVGRITLFLYCFDFCATPITVWYLHPSGIVQSFAIAFGVVAVGVFVNLAWEYAILPELKRAFNQQR